ncbi:prefoldin-like protein ASCRUDRAFT_7764 [Ascoidea rubescens DSM 1968]|uniref:DUF3835 domain-containing protein n=1 Tax=Ascoidea rubescens DSM 1968 TaxID=1344418 RepID=A0A1D2VJ92_9ASCO|nr:hypothetical protein ASCRUDRAFT_7764 [Ascoidea rubescens DSM 1968]ODV61547.1 hypothetical protein ASCRUDRAFT_7764 [Ascoidea rubescens DSM 1968]
MSSETDIVASVLQKLIEPGTYNASSPTSSGSSDSHRLSSYIDLTNQLNSSINNFRQKISRLDAYEDELRSLQKKIAEGGSHQKSPQIETKNNADSTISKQNSDKKSNNKILDLLNQKFKLVEKSKSLFNEKIEEANQLLKNIELLQKNDSFQDLHLQKDLFDNVNEKINDDKIVNNPSPYQNEEGLPFMEIKEELDENGNILNSSVEPHNSLIVNQKLSDLDKNITKKTIQNTSPKSMETIIKQQNNVNFQDNSNFPLMEIREELDENDNVISSTVSPHKPSNINKMKNNTKNHQVKDKIKMKQNSKLDQKENQITPELNSEIKTQIKNQNINQYDFEEINDLMKDMYINHEKINPENKKFQKIDEIDDEIKKIDNELEKIRIKNQKIEKQLLSHDLHKNQDNNQIKNQKKITEKKLKTQPDNKINIDPALKDTPLYIHDVTNNDDITLSEASEQITSILNISNDLPKDWTPDKPAIATEDLLELQMLNEELANNDDDDMHFDDDEEWEFEFSSDEDDNSNHQANLKNQKLKPKSLTDNTRSKNSIEFDQSLLPVPKEASKLFLNEILKIRIKNIKENQNQNLNETKEINENQDDNENETDDDALLAEIMSKTSINSDSDDDDDGDDDDDYQKYIYQKPNTQVLKTKGFPKNNKLQNYNPFNSQGFQSEIILPEDSYLSNPELNPQTIKTNSKPTIKSNLKKGKSKKKKKSVSFASELQIKEIENVSKELKNIYDNPANLPTRKMSRFKLERNKYYNLDSSYPPHLLGHPISAGFTDEEIIKEESDEDEYDDEKAKKGKNNASIIKDIKDRSIENNRNSFNFKDNKNSDYDFNKIVSKEISKKNTSFQNQKVLCSINQKAPLKEKISKFKKDLNKSNMHSTGFRSEIITDSSLIDPSKNTALQKTRPIKPDLEKKYKGLFIESKRPIRKKPLNKINRSLEAKGKTLGETSKVNENTGNTFVKKPSKLSRFKQMRETEKQYTNQGVQLSNNLDSFNSLKNSQTSTLKRVYKSDLQSLIRKKKINDKNANVSIKIPEVKPDYLKILKQEKIQSKKNKVEKIEKQKATMKSKQPHLNSKGKLDYESIDDLDSMAQAYINGLYDDDIEHNGNPGSVIERPEDIEKYNNQINELQKMYPEEFDLIDDENRQFYEEKNKENEDYSENNNKDQKNDENDNEEDDNRPVLSKEILEHEPNEFDELVDDDTFDEDIFDQELSLDYHRLRDKFINMNGGYKKRVDELEIEPIDEHGNTIKVSRFKAARFIPKNN